MSLLDDIAGLDLSGVLSARGGISASVQGADVQAVVGGGAVTSALGGFGAALAAAQGALDDPSTLLAPLVGALTELAGRVGPGDLPLGELAAAVSEGIGVLVGLLDGVETDPLAIGRVLGRSLPEAFRAVERSVEGYTMVGLGELGRFASLTGQLDGAAPSEPGLLADLAVDVLAPFPRGAVRRLRADVDAVLSATAAVSLPTTRTQGLVLRLDAVSAAAAAGDATAVRRALADLAAVRAEALVQLRADLTGLVGLVDRLPLAAITGTLAEVDHGLTAAADGVLELLEDWRAEIGTLRGVVEGLDPAAVRAAMDALLDQLEAFLRAQFEAPIEAATQAAVGWVKSLLAHLPIRDLRAAVSGGIHTAVQAVLDADLDGPAEQVKAVLGQVREALSVADLSAQVRAALAGVVNTLHGALDGIIAALDSVRAAIEAVAGTAADVLGRAVDSVTEFHAEVETLTATLDAVDLTGAAQQVVANVRQIREAVEGVVSTVPLPEPVRPLVQQLADQLDALHLDAADPADVPILAPLLDSVTAGVSIDATLQATVHEGIAALRDAVANLVPAELVASIQQEVQAALDVVGGFDPASLLSGVTEQIAAVADRIDGFDLAAAAEPAHAPFQAILETWDKVRPSVLLAPVVEGFESVLSGVSIPSPQAVVEALGASANTGGEALGQAVAGSVSRVAPVGTTPAPPPGGGAAGGGPSGGGAGGTGTGTGGGLPVDLPTELRAGDIVRMIGYLPAKLRETLAGLDAGVAGAVVAQIDGLVAGLARDLRAAGRAVAEVEQRLDGSLDALLRPLGAAQARAQLSLHAHFAVGAGGGGSGAGGSGAGGSAGVELDVDAAMAAVASAGPGSLRAELVGPAGQVRDRVRLAADRHGSAGARLVAIADALDRTPLARISTDLDTLLAALDLEPLAAELDALVATALAKLPAFVAQFGGELESAGMRLEALLRGLNPGVLAQRVARGILGAIQQELEALDPRRLAAELDELHAAVRASIAAYDPAALVAELDAVKDQIVADLRGLDPAALLGDLSGLTDLLDKAAQAVPTDVLTGLPDQLTALDEAFAGIDLDALLARIVAIPTDVPAALVTVLAGIQTEVRALLESLRYATGQIEVHAEVHAG